MVDKEVIAGQLLEMFTSGMPEFDEEGEVVKEGATAEDAAGKLAEIIRNAICSATVTYVSGLLAEAIPVKADKEQEFKIE